MSPVNILIMAGGTGGHIFPALAVARELRERGVNVTWLGTQRGLESRIVPEAGFPIDYIDIGGLRGNGILGWLLAPLKIARAVGQALAIMQRRRPGAVLGMGGYVTGPGGVAARLSGRPLIIHEQNAIAGLTNRLLARIAQTVLEAFPGTFPRSSRVWEMGNPVRREIARITAPQERLVQREAGLRLLVIGGSLGAVALNTLVPLALVGMSEQQRPVVRHQAGARNLAQTQAAYADAGIQAEVSAFIDDMAEAYTWADIVLCRAGALTVSELAAAGVAALLVPYPHAVDDHQSANALVLVRAGAARLLPQASLDATQLADVLGEFAEDARSGRAKLMAMSTAARDEAKIDAAQRVAHICLTAAGVGSGESRDE